MKRVVLLDLDDTLLDFGKAEKRAMCRTLTEWHLPTDDATLALYSRINDAYWKLFERGEIDRREVLVGRFRDFFAALGVRDTDAEAVQNRYETLLAEGHWFVPGAEELLPALAPHYDLYLASNGTEKVQMGRLTSAGILPYFRGLFLSERIGVAKPSAAFFDAVFAAIGEERRRGAVMVGDSLTSDIRGGIDAGLVTVWFNPRGKAKDPAVAPDKIITSLGELPDFLGSLPSLNA